MSTPAPTVSIVIPAYNEEASIRACIVAAILQTVPASEILVIDNRSTDATAAVVAAVQEEYPASSVVYFRQDEAQGLVPTRNFGLNRAHGDVIGRIDADSVVEPTIGALDDEDVKAAFADEPDCEHVIQPF